MAGHRSFLDIVDDLAKFGSSLHQPTTPAYVQHEGHYQYVLQLHGILQPRLHVSFIFLPVSAKVSTLSKSGLTDLIRFRSGHHRAIHRYLHVKRKCGTRHCSSFCDEGNEPVDHVCLRCTAFMTHSHQLQLHQAFDELVCLPHSALALLMSNLTCPTSAAAGFSRLGLISIFFI